MSEVKKPLGVSAELDFCPEPEIERAFDWLIGFLPAGEWDKRKAAIEKHIETKLASPGGDSSFKRLVPATDRIGWYLYLVYTSQHEPYRAEIHEAARVLPVFKRLGTDLDQLQKVGGIETQAKKLLSPSEALPDSLLFEMLVALLWVKNGWQDVSFIPAVKSEKRPDIGAANGADEWFIETKRLSSQSEYARKEREKWLCMWSKLKDLLVANRYPFVLDITFHVELRDLPDSFLVDQLKTKLKIVTQPCTLISDERWEVGVSYVDMERIKAHLAAQLVKSQSRQLDELIGGSWERGKPFTHIMAAKLRRVGGSHGVNLYVDDIEWAAGAYRRCDADEAIEAKARDVRSHLADAVSQLPSKGRGVVHVGIECQDGEVVEAERYAKINNTVSTFDAKGKDLRFIYTHLFESYSPPDKPWFIDETVYKFGANLKDNPEPITIQSVIVPEDDSGAGGIHWLHDPP